MERHRCKLCKRRFANGRALGGHMRSHMIHPPQQPSRRRRLTESPPESSRSLSSSYSYSSPSSENDEKYDDNDARDSSYGLRENPKRSVRVTNPEFSSSTVVDRESETESSKNPTPPPPSRTRRSLASAAETRRRNSPGNENEKSEEPASSVSDTSAEEDLAFCLIMLSRDQWDPSKKQKLKSEEEEEDDSRSFETTNRNKISSDGDGFRNFQKKKPSKKRSTTSVTHQCPICYRVFATGQALGGHKRAHFNAEKKNDELGVSAPESERGFRLIDLNLPPPDHPDQENETYYDHDSTSQLAVSSASVSDPNLS